MAGRCGGAAFAATGAFLEDEAADDKDGGAPRRAAADFRAPVEARREEAGVAFGSGFFAWLLPEARRASFSWSESFLIWALSAMISLSLREQAEQNIAERLKNRLNLRASNAKPKPNQLLAKVNAFAAGAIEAGKNQEPPPSAKLLFVKPAL